MRNRHVFLDDPALGIHDLPDSSAEAIIEPLLDCAAESASLLARKHPVAIGDETYQLPKFLLLGERGGGVPIKLGLYAGLDAGQVDTVIAAVRLLLQLELMPHLAKDYAIFGYPIVNLPGFSDAKNSLTEFRNRYANNAPDGDIRYYKSDFAKWKHDGLIFLRSSGVNAGLAATVRSEVLSREVVLPALESLGGSIPLARQPVRVLPSGYEARLADHISGRLLPSLDTNPWPFEIELFAPASADTEIRVRSLFLSVVEILRRYRQFIAHGGTL